MKKNEQVSGSPTIRPVKAPTFVSYEITGEPLPDKHVARLPDRVRDQIVQIHGLIRTDPYAAISRISKLNKKYRNVPVLYNYLIAAYQMLGDEEKVKSLVLESYKRWPDYLFAKINYAHHCLRVGDVEKVPEIFDYKFDLKLLYPSRDKFHISEAVNFMGVMASYFHAIGDNETARMYYHVMKKLDRRHTITKSVKRQLYPSLIVKLLKRASKYVDERESQRGVGA